MIFAVAKPLPSEADAITVDLKNADANAAAFKYIGQPRYATPEADSSAMFDINVNTLQNVTAALVPGMIAQGPGEIVTIFAMSGRRGKAYMAAISSARAEVMRSSESLYAKLKTKGINVNAVLPSISVTPKNRAELPGADPAAWVGPAKLANVTCFLCSDAARAIHGALLPVTGLL